MCTPPVQFADFFGNAKEQTDVGVKKKRSKSNPIFLLPARRDDLSREPTIFVISELRSGTRRKVFSDRPSCKEMAPALILTDQCSWIGRQGKRQVGSSQKRGMTNTK